VASSMLGIPGDSGTKGIGSGRRAMVGVLASVSPADLYIFRRAGSVRVPSISVPGIVSQCGHLGGMSA